jgi:hypothetical protein
VANVNRLINQRQRLAKDVRRRPAVTDTLYLQGSETLANGLALFDLEWGNIQAGHAWVAAQSVEADESIAQLAITYPFRQCPCIPG